MNANDTRLVHDFMRVTKGDGDSRLQLAIIEWPGPHSPELRWKDYRTWSKPPNPEQLTAARRLALQDTRFFKVCRKCGERNNASHMHDTETCQACAERHLSVIY